MKTSTWLWGLKTLINMAVLCLSVSCSVEEAVEILGGRSQTPVFLGYKASGGQTLQFRFSQAVEVLAFTTEPALPVESIEGGEVVRVNLSARVPGGEPYAADILVKDEGGNTLNVLVPFRSRNERLPKLLINELRTEYSRPKAEFVELKALEAGNLGALRLFISGNTKAPLVFEFPPAEVAAGDYIVVHLRTLEEDAVNEHTGDPALSGGTDAAKTAWDFWVPGTEKLLHKTDTVYLMDQDDRIVDAVMMSENPDPWWTKDHFVQAADLLYQAGAWNSADGEIPSPIDAVITASIKTAMTRSISRDETVEDRNTAADWYISATSAATPGAKNNPNRYVE
ncbi:MAG: lamin tail domain-containing protein [Treponema sp.]|jgi:hypothetical protein|nr:lamin tail domain-containing protein [Treponema sp.]